MGCTPRRSSRSQRNDSPRYLRPENLEGASVADCNLNADAYGNLANIGPLILHCPKQYSMFETMNPLPSCLKVKDRSFHSRNPSHVSKFLMLQKNFIPTDSHHASAVTSSSSNLSSAFPLCYSDQHLPDGSKLNSSKASLSSSQLIESDKIGLQQRFPPSKLDSLNARCPSNLERTSEKGQHVECDLTLRLGSVVAHHASIENSWSVQVGNGDRNPDVIKFKNHLNQ